MATETNYYLGSYLKLVSPVSFDEILGAIQLSIFSDIRAYLFDVLSKKNQFGKWEICLISNDSDLSGEQIELNEPFEYPISGAIQYNNIECMKEMFEEFFENQITTLQNSIGEDNVTVEFGMLIYNS